MVVLKETREKRLLSGAGHWPVLRTKGGQEVFVWPSRFKE